MDPTDFDVPIPEPEFIDPFDLEDPPAPPPRTVEELEQEWQILRARVAELESKVNGMHASFARLSRLFEATKTAVCDAIGPEWLARVRTLMRLDLDEDFAGEIRRPQSFEGEIR